MKAMNAASDQYLEFQDGDKVTQQSWETAFSKIPGILKVERDSREDPDLKELLYIRGIIRNKCGYFRDWEALDRLRVARSWGVPMAGLKKLAYGVRSWSHFIDQISAMVEEYKAAQNKH